MNRKILIVDSDETTVDCIGAGLRKAGYEVARAADGFEALGHMRKFKPDIILSEIDLPKLDGLDFAMALRAKPETTDIPVIFISGKTDPETLKQARGLGARKFIEKPFDMDNLLKVVKTLLDG